MLELDVQSEDGEERYPVIGETGAGRPLFVIYTIRDGLLRPVTACPPEGYLKRVYFHEKGLRR